MNLLVLLLISGKNKFSVRQAAITSDGVVSGDTDETAYISLKQLGFPDDTQISYTHASKIFTFFSASAGKIPSVRATFEDGSKFFLGGSMFTIHYRDDTNNTISIYETGLGAD